MVEWHHQLKGHESEQTPGDSEGHGSLLCCSPWGRRVGHDWVTEQWTITQYSCLENHMDRGTWRATDHGVAKSQTCLSLSLSKPVSGCPQRDILGWPRDICFSFSSYWFHFSVEIITAHMHSPKLTVVFCSLFMTTRQGGELRITRLVSSAYFSNLMRGSLCRKFYLHSEGSSPRALGH